VRIVESPNNWSCVPAAFATATGLPFDLLLDKIGHDGSQIIFPDLPEPLCRRGFLGQELAYTLLTLGWLVASYEFAPYGIVDGDHAFEMRWENMDDVKSTILRNSIGVIAGIVNTTNRPHATAWDGKKCYDPSGFVYDLDRYTPEIYYRLQPFAL